MQPKGMAYHQVPPISQQDRELQAPRDPDSREPEIGADSREPEIGGEDSDCVSKLANICY